MGRDLKQNWTLGGRPSALNGWIEEWSVDVYKSQKLDAILCIFVAVSPTKK